jgi:hypothetical protein
LFSGLPRLTAALTRRYAHRTAAIRAKWVLLVLFGLGALALWSGSEAVLRNIPVTLCPSAMAATGAAICGDRLADGWIVFTDRDRDQVVDAGADEVIRVFEQVPAGYSLSNLAGTVPAGDAVTYLPDGAPVATVPAGVLARRLPGEPWAVVLNM